MHDPSNATFALKASLSLNEDRPILYAQTMSPCPSAKMPVNLKAVKSLGVGSQMVLGEKLELFSSQSFTILSHFTPIVYELFLDKLT